MSTSDRIAAWMRRQMTAAGARGFVVGLSGGIDSAVVARLSQLAAPGNVVAAILPSQSDPQDERDAMELARHFSLMTVRVDLSSTYETLAADAQVAVSTLPQHLRTSPPADPLRGRVPLANMNGGIEYSSRTVSPASASNTNSANPHCGFPM